MRGEDIAKILTDFLWGSPTPYLAVFSHDEIAQSFTRYPCAYVAKTDASSLPGQLWFAFSHRSPTHLEFFDSYCCRPDVYHFPIPPFITQIDINYHQIRSDKSSDCGQF